MALIDVRTVKVIADDLGPEMAIQFLSMLPGEVAPLVDELSASIAANDPARFAEARHTLKGVLGSMGASALAKALDATRGLEPAMPAMTTAMITVRQLADETTTEAQRLAGILKDGGAL